MLRDAPNEFREPVALGFAEQPVLDTPSDELAGFI